MSNESGLRAALAREQNKLLRQEAAIDATHAMIDLLDVQIEIASKKK